VHPVLFRIPGTHLTVYSYGLMLVLGFLAAVWVIKHLSRGFSPNRDVVVNAALWALVAGLIGARAFYVLHHLREFTGNWTAVYTVWRGGLELLGGALLAILVILLYIRRYRLPARKYMDVVAIGLFVALAIGRIGCFLNGCCFGRPTSLPWGVRFPYGSLAYESQIRPDPMRGRDAPYVNLPADFWVISDNGTYLKDFDQLDSGQRAAVTTGPYRPLPVHPTQLYESAGAIIAAVLLYLYWRWGSSGESRRKEAWYYPRQGYVFALMLMLYGAMRFANELVRDDNPFEFDGLTISQNLAIVMVVAGVIVLAVCRRLPPRRDSAGSGRAEHRA
jgi:phosphatidylglycerol:prolipoprotein diacylglycerol transferase